MFIFRFPKTDTKSENEDEKQEAYFNITFAVRSFYDYVNKIIISDYYVLFEINCRLRLSNQIKIY